MQELAGDPGGPATEQNEVPSEDEVTSPAVAILALIARGHGVACSVQIRDAVVGLKRRLGVFRPNVTRVEPPEIGLSQQPGFAEAETAVDWDAKLLPELRAHGKHEAVRVTDVDPGGRRQGDETALFRGIRPQLERGLELRDSARELTLRPIAVKPGATQFPRKHRIHGNRAVGGHDEVAAARGATRVAPGVYSGVASDPAGASATHGSFAAGIARRARAAPVCRSPAGAGLDRLGFAAARGEQRGTREHDAPVAE